MPYCIRAEDGSYEYVFTREEMARIGVINLEVLEQWNEDKKND